MGDSPYGAGDSSIGSGYKVSTHRGLSSSGSSKSNYPNPFFDVAATYIPTDIQQLYRWCRYYAMANPLVSAVLYKVSAYPVTEVVYDTSNEGLKHKWYTLLEDNFRIRTFLIEMNLDRNAYGNAYASVAFPFRKHLKCYKCKHSAPINRTKYRYKNYDFYSVCTKCGTSGQMKAEDVYYRSSRGIRLVRWDPEHIRVKYDEATGIRTYYYVMPRKLANDITVGKPDVIENVPQHFIKAIRKKRTIVFLQDQIFHMRRPSVSRKDSGLGMPMVIPVLKDIFYLQVLKKAQEAIFFGYVTPMRIIYPAASSADGSPYSATSLSKWRDKVQGEIGKFKRDPNYFSVMPLPVGYQAVGGEAKALSLSQEIRVWSEQIIAGLGVPQEFIYGGLSYSGSSVSLRILENDFIGNREDTLALMRFLRDKIAAHMGWQKIKLRLKPFKMADDLQRAAFDLQLAQQKYISKRSVLEMRDYDPQTERDRVQKEQGADLELSRKEMEYNADSQGRAQLIQTKYQIEMQQMQQQAQPEPDPLMQAQAQAQEQAQAQQPAPATQPGMAPPGVPMDPSTGMPMDPRQMGPPQQKPPQSSIGGEGSIVRNLSSPLNVESVQQGMSGAQTPEDLEALAQDLVRQIASAPPEQQGQMLGSIKMQNPQLYTRVVELLYQPEAAQPLPEQGPPMRGPNTAQV